MRQQSEFINFGIVWTPLFSTFLDISTVIIIIININIIIIIYLFVQIGNQDTYSQSVQS